MGVSDKKMCYRCLHYGIPKQRKKKGYGENLYLSCSKCKCFVFWDFDREYGDFNSSERTIDNVVEQTFGLKDSAEPAEIDEKISSAIDMELNDKEENSASDFASDSANTNIWDTPDEDEESDIPAFLRRRNRKNKEKQA